MKAVYDFELANKAFERMTLAEREQALKEFAKLRYPSITDRFFEAIHRVIVRATPPEDHQP